jgi:hypothetical protein
MFEYRYIPVLSVTIILHSHECTYVNGEVGGLFICRESLSSNVDCKTFYFTAWVINELLKQEMIF